MQKMSKSRSVSAVQDTGREKNMTHKELGDALLLIDGDNAKKGRQARSKIMELGDKLRQLREDILGITQIQAAKLIGINQSELSRLENGVGSRGPSYLTIMRIVEAYQSYLQKKNIKNYMNLTIQLLSNNSHKEKKILLSSNGM